MRSSLRKVLHPLLGLPTLDHVIRQLRLAGAADITVVVGHGADSIRAHLDGSDIRLALQDPPRGTGHAVLEALDQSPPRFDTVMIVNGDLPDLDVELLQGIVSSHNNSDHTFTVATSILNDPFGMGRIIRDSEMVSEVGSEGALDGIVEQKERAPDDEEIHEVNLGIYALDHKKTLPALRFLVEEDLSSGDPEKEAYLTRLVEVLKERDLGVGTHDCCVDKEFAQVNDRQQLAQASRQIQQRIQRDHMSRGVTIVDPLTTWIEMDVSIGQDTLIQPQTVIRRGVEIGTDCEVGPFAHIRSGSVLGNGVVIGDFVEVNRSQLKDGAKAKHLAYLGDATIEENANIGAGAVVANYDGVNKHHTLIKEGAFVGSGSVIVAPGHVGKNATIGAGAVVPPGKVIEDGTTVIGVPAKKMVKKSQSNSEDGDDEKGS